MKRRVVVSGMGAVSPIGNSVEELWQGIRTHRCGIDAITHFDTADYKVKLAAEVKDLDMEQYFSKRCWTAAWMYTRKTWSASV